MLYASDKEILEAYEILKFNTPHASTVTKTQRGKPYKDIPIKILKSSMFYKSYIPYQQRTEMYVAYRAKLLLEPVNPKVNSKYLVDKLHKELEIYADNALKIGNAKKSSANSLYKASKLQATPILDTWDKMYIHNIYKTAQWLSTFCKQYEVDHILPLAKGGTHEPANLQILPAEINLLKSDRLDFYS